MTYLIELYFIQMMIDSKTSPKGTNSGGGN